VPVVAVPYPLHSGDWPGSIVAPLPGL